MPANLSPEYKNAQDAFRRASEPQEKLSCLKEMLRTIPKHKGTEHLQADIKTRIKELTEELAGPRKGGARGGPELSVRPEGAAQVALIGPPNAGKSSLFNALLGEDRAIVDDEAGTTRDVVTDSLDLDGLRFVLHDTAGLHEDAAGVEARRDAMVAGQPVNATEGRAVLHMALRGGAQAPAGDDVEATLARFLAFAEAVRSADVVLTSTGSGTHVLTPAIVGAQGRAGRPVMIIDIAVPRDVAPEVGELDEEALVKILTEPRNALTKQYQKLFDMEGSEVEFREDALRAVARKAMERKTGARGLRTILEQVLLDTMYDLPSMENVRKVVIDESVILGNSKPYMIFDASEPMAASE